MPPMRAFFLSGAELNIILEFHQGFTLSGAYVPPDLIHQGHMPLKPQGSTHYLIV